MKLFHRLLLIFFVAIGNSRYGHAQAVAPSSYKVTIKGTSNLHDWNENVGKVTGSANITHNKNGGVNIASLSLTIVVSSIKSTEGSIMDKNTYRALKESQYPEITYVLVAPVSSVAATAGIYTLKAKGRVTIAGVTKDVEMNVKIHAEGSKLVFEGVQQIKMTDYNISPPTAMFGALKTGDDITINYKMVF